MKPEDQLDRPYEEWAQYPPDPWKPWKRRLVVAAFGAGVGMLVGAIVNGIVVVVRPDLHSAMSWGYLGFFCCGGVIYALTENWKD